MKYWILLLILTISYATGFAVPRSDPYPKNPNIDALNYQFKIHLSDTTDEIRCLETIDIQFLSEGITTLRLDLVKASEKLGGKGMHVNSVVSNGKELNYSHENDVLTIALPTSSAVHQRASYTISYHGTPASGLKIADNKYGDRTFFSDNWPNKGRNWLATIDHPYDKAMCEFIVTAPDHYQVVSNGLKVEESNLPNGERLTHWKQSVPIATWLYVLGVAKFAVQYVDQFKGKSIETWVYPQDRDAGFYDFAIPAKSALEFYNDKIGPFSYEKLANIQSNSVSGGMEAASAILYSENSVVGDRNHRWRNVVIHEIAHQWFGNSVTEYDWDDVWLSEGFATYFTLLFIEHQYGRDVFIEGLASSKKKVDMFYSKNPEYTIVHDNLANMADVVTMQTYQKGSWVLHMLRGIVGTDAFWKGIQSYYSKYKDLNATTNDFRIEMEAASGKDLKLFFNQWLYQPGTLKYKGYWKFDKNKKEITMQLDQVQSDGSFYKMPIEIGFYDQENKQQLIQTVQADAVANSFKFNVDFEPKSLKLDPNFKVLMDADFKRK